MGKTLLTLSRAAVSERQITLEGALYGSKIAGRGCRRCCTMCSHRRILCEVCEHTDCASIVASIVSAVSSKQTITGVPLWRVFHCQMCTQHTPAIVLKHRGIMPTLRCAWCVASTALFVSPLFMSFSSNFKCSKSDKTR